MLVDLRNIALATSVPYIEDGTTIISDVVASVTAQIADTVANTPNLVQTLTDIPTASLTDLEKVDIRRHCGYMAYGDPATISTGYRYFQQYGLLEYRMNHFSNEEISTIRVKYLERLNTLEDQFFESGDDLDTDTAAVWKRNKAQLRDRKWLYEHWGQRLCVFIGVVYMPYPNPAFEQHGPFRRII